MATIPLLCNICPKKPVFSDVSHLLTHIASKGHLSHYYKLKVRSSTDSASKQVVDAYDRWYSEWNVEDLMSERMTMKDKKKPRARVSGDAACCPRPDWLWAYRNTVASRASSVAPSASTSKSQRNAASRQSSTNSRAPPSYQHPPSTSMVDPRLTEDPIKYEPGMTPQPYHLDHPIMHGNSLPTAYSSTHRYANGGQFPGLPMQSNIRNPSMYVSCDSGLGEEGKENIPNPYFIGTQKSQTPYGAPATISSDSGAKTPTNADDDDAPATPENGTSRLKGVLWPGMSIFDSATPTARRRRNQKKNNSIIEQLEANSLEVEPTEMVWTSAGDLKKELLITGMVDENSSPWKSSPIKYPRTALAELDIPRPYFGNTQLPRYDTYTNERAENALMYGDFPDGRQNRNKRRRGLEIWQDENDDRHNEGDDQRDIVYSKPIGLNLLTRSFDHEGHSHLRCAAESSNATDPKLLEDPFTSHAQRSQVNQLQAQTHDTQFNPFVVPRSNNYGYVAPLSVNSTSQNALQVMKHTNHHGYIGPSGSNTAIVGHDFGGWLQPQPAQPNHVRTHSRSMSWAIAYAQLDPPMAPTTSTSSTMFSNPLPGMTFPFSAPQNDTWGHKPRMSQDFQALFAAQGFWGFGTMINPSTEQQYFEAPHTGSNNDTSAIQEDATQPAGDLLALHQQGVNMARTNFRDVDGMNALSDAAEMSAYTVVEEAPVVKVEGHTGIVPHVEQEAVEAESENDEVESVSEGRTITAPGTPMEPTDG